MTVLPSCVPFEKIDSSGDGQEANNVPPGQHQGFDPTLS